MLTYYAGPRLVPLEVVATITSYREAVRTCWQMRLRTSLTRRALAEEAGLYASHITDYLSQEPGRRNLPAEHIDAMEIACGNRVISQYLNMKHHLTILEQFLPQHRAAA